MNNMDKDFSGFTAGTLVHTETGLVPIEQLEIGDKVLSKAADGLGDLVYKRITRTTTNDASIFMMYFNTYVNPQLNLADRVNLRRKLKKQQILPEPLLMTADHPFWTQNRGWVRADKLNAQDILVTKDNTYFTTDSGGGYDYRYEGIIPMYHANKKGYAYQVSFGDETGELKGSYVNLLTGRYELYTDPAPTWINKLWQADSEWEQRLLEKTPKDEREHAEFFGFRQGEWKDPNTIDWAEGEGPLTMTVYNIEVEDTHTYFVGEQGLWVNE
jgi:hypothetical protein|tara:strand:- start:929 stop:1741 length:813 start_codon:yes stop_codon:yes gene_type:complete